MKTKLTLQEKLRDLREERKLKLAEVAEQTGIPLSTLGRMEAEDDVRTGYQDIAALARFYEVSGDYLLGLTENRRQRGTPLDALALADNAVVALKSGRLNNKLLCELMTHPEFVPLLGAVEIYIDRKTLPQTGVMNAVNQVAESTLREVFDADDEDEIIRFLQDAVVNEDEFYRYRISERFNLLMKSMFEAHKQDALPKEQAELVADMKSDIRALLSSKEPANRAALVLWGKQFGLNLTSLTPEEVSVMERAVQKSGTYKQGKSMMARKKRKR